MRWEMKENVQTNERGVRQVNRGLVWQAAIRVNTTAFSESTPTRPIKRPQQNKQTKLSIGLSVDTIKTPMPVRKQTKELPGTPYRVFGTPNPAPTMATVYILPDHRAHLL